MEESSSAASASALASSSESTASAHELYTTLKNSYNKVSNNNGNKEELLSLINEMPDLMNNLVKAIYSEGLISKNEELDDISTESLKVIIIT